MKTKKEKSKTTKKVKLPFWLQIAAIVLAGVLVSGAILLFAKEHKKPVYTLTFSYQDGTVIDMREVKSGKGVYPPDFEHQGIFRGWSGPINNVTADTEVHPMLYEITENNLFYFESLYVKEGKEFTIDVRLGGKVNIAAADLVLEYDSDVMTFKTAESEDCVKVEKGDKSTVKVTLKSDNNLTEACSLAKLTFKARRADALSSEITLNAENGTTFAKGKEMPAEFATINNNIYFLQEVM